MSRFLLCLKVCAKDISGPARSTIAASIRSIGRMCSRRIGLLGKAVNDVVEIGD
ncbi:MAG: hypothetical protein R8G34_12200 [Paracoccaceae bacterium]|nr:hypothetical protein [Paracoccaceae bacterium]